MGQDVADDVVFQRLVEHGFPPWETEIHGKWIDTQKALRGAQKGQPVALVPANWELMSMDENGKLTAHATSVLAFDISRAGTLVYSNGSEIFSLRAGNKPERLCSQRMIQQVMAFG